LSPAFSLGLFLHAVSEFRPPAFSDGRKAAALPKMTVMAYYVENDDAKEERVSVFEEKLKESEAKL
jgi:hypothetical protein